MDARTCPFCGAELRAGVLGGLCPRCVLKRTLTKVPVSPRHLLPEAPTPFWNQRVPHL